MRLPDQGLRGSGGRLKPGSLLDLARVLLGSETSLSPLVSSSDSLVKYKRQTLRALTPIPVPVIIPRVAIKGTSCMALCDLTWVVGKRWTGRSDVAKGNGGSKEA